MVTTSSNNAPTTPPNKNNPKVNYRLISQLVLIVIATGALVCLAWQNQQLNQQNQQLNTEITELRKTAKKPTNPATPNNTQQPGNTPNQPGTQPDHPGDDFFKPSNDLIDNFTAILNTLNTQPLEGYLADEVKLFYASNTPATTLTNKARITKSLEYFSDAKIPWNFRLPSDHLAHYQKKFDKLFDKGCLAGASADVGHVVSFCFNKEGKIHSIFLCRDPRVFN